MDGASSRVQSTPHDDPLSSVQKEQVATRWGELQAYAQLRGRPRPTNDSWIAVCCLVRDLPLATFNTKDFADFAEHERLFLVQPA